MWGRILSPICRCSQFLVTRKEGRVLSSAWGFCSVFRSHILIHMDRLLPGHMWQQSCAGERSSDTGSGALPGEEARGALPAAGSFAHANAPKG